MGVGSSCSWPTRGNRAASTDPSSPTIAIAPLPGSMKGLPCSHCGPGMMERRQVRRRASHSQPAVRPGGECTAPASGVRHRAARGPCDHRTRWGRDADGAPSVAPVGRPPTPKVPRGSGASGPSSGDRRRVGGRAWGPRRWRLRAPAWAAGAGRVRRWVRIWLVVPRPASSAPPDASRDPRSSTRFPPAGIARASPRDRTARYPVKGLPRTGAPARAPRRSVPTPAGRTSPSSKTAREVPAPWCASRGVGLTSSTPSTHSYRCDGSSGSDWTSAAFQKRSATAGMAIVCRRDEKVGKRA
jgi:hypothetical protein